MFTRSLLFLTLLSISHNPTCLKAAEKTSSERSPLKPLALKTRQEHAQHPVTQKLLEIMQTKKTNLCVAFDVTTQQELFALLEQVGQHICIAKLHIDILTDFDHTVPEKLRKAAERDNFLLFEDRKYADIGNTVQHQFANGIYKTADWADIVNAHILPGEAIITALKEVAEGKKRAIGLLLLAQMSSKGHYLTSNYTKAAVELAEKHSDFVMGFICQEKLSDSPDLLHMTPGVKLGDKSDKLGQQYNTPAYVVGQKGVDITIVGRGVIESENPALAAQEYKEQSWSAYIN